MNKKSLHILCLVSTLVIQQADKSAAQYTPLKTKVEIEIVDKSFAYGPTDRVVPLRIYLPKTGALNPVILFSHGLGGSRQASRNDNEYM